MSNSRDCTVRRSLHQSEAAGTELQQRPFGKVPYSPPPSSSLSPSLLHSQVCQQAGSTQWPVSAIYSIHVFIVYMYTVCSSVVFRYIDMCVS